MKEIHKMDLKAKKEKFEAEKKIYESAKLSFSGVEGFDVYNASILFFMNGKQYIFGRVEKRDEWARSWVRLFENDGKDKWKLVPGSMIYQLEDPYIAFIDNQLVMGGTHVRYSGGKVETYYGYFYRGTDINDMYYFTTGPDCMKDIRLVQLSGGRIGVFSRPRGADVLEKYGRESVIGFAIANSLDDINSELVENAKVIDGLIGDGEWGGCNQCYPLKSGRIGVIGHQCFDDNGISVYMNTAFIFDPESFEVSNFKIIGTRGCYPDGPAKKPNLVDCAFSSGIVLREDGLVDLYSGIGDTEVGRITIDNPFDGDEIISVH